MGAQELRLQAALEGDESLAAWTEWKSRTTTMESDADAFPLLLFVDVNIADLAPYDPELPRLKGVHRSAWIKNQPAARARGRVIRELSEAPG